MSRTTVTLLACVVMLTGCVHTSLREPSPTPVSTAACPVTLPVPPATILPAAARPIISGQQGGPPLTPSMDGNDALWVEIPTDGTVLARPDADGWLSDKIPTVRLIAGTLTAQVRRLDGPAAAGRVSILDGYGPRGFLVLRHLRPLRGLLGDHAADRESGTARRRRDPSHAIGRVRLVSRTTNHRNAPYAMQTPCQWLGICSGFCSAERSA